jgi:hypothetical protein
VCAAAATCGFLTRRAIAPTRSRATCAEILRRTAPAVRVSMVARSAAAMATA